MGDEAPAYDALNSLLQFSILMEAVPRIEGIEDFLDFKHVDEVARDIVREVSPRSVDAENRGCGVKYRHRDGAS